MELLILFSLLSCIYSLYSPQDDVITLTAQNFDSLVLGSPKVWLVEFYAPWCGHCQRLTPEYKKAAKSLKNIVQVGAIDCNEDSNRPVCGKYGIQGFPTIKLFPGDRTGTKKYPIDYNGERVSKAMKQFSLDRIPDKYVIQIKSKGPETLETFFGEKNETLTKVILFTNKPVTSPLYKALSLEFKDQLYMGQVKNTEKEILQQFNIETLPLLLVVPAGKSEPVVYDGSLKHSFLHPFLSQFVKNKKSKSKTSSDQETAVPTQTEPFDPTIPQIMNSADFKKQCSQKSKEGISTLCFLAFLPPLETEFQESVQQHQDLISLLKSTKEFLYLKRSEQSKPLPNILFMWTFGNFPEIQSIIYKFGVSSDLPSALILHTGKKVYRPYIGSFDTDGLKSFVNEISAGKGRVFNYDWELSFPDLEPLQNEQITKEEETCSTNEEKCSSKPNHDEL